MKPVNVNVKDNIRLPFCIEILFYTRYMQFKLFYFFLTWICSKTLLFNRKNVYLIKYSCVLQRKNFKFRLVTVDDTLQIVGCCYYLFLSIFLLFFLRRN